MPVSVWVHVPVHAHVEARAGPGVSASVTLPYSLEPGCHRSSLFQLGCLVSVLLGSPYLPLFSSAGVAGTHRHAQLFMWLARDLNSDPPACRASPLTKQCLQPRVYVLANRKAVRATVAVRHRSHVT